jgi:hypothetical protein
MRRNASKLHWWGGLAVVVLGLVIGSLAFMMVQGVWVWAATTFSPTYTVDVDDTTTGTDPDNRTSSDITTAFGVPAPDVMYDIQISFTPGDPDDPTAGFYVAKGEDIPDGTDVGTLDAAATLGLLNGPCNPFPTIKFDLVDASVNTGDTITFDEQFQKEGGIYKGALHYPDFLNTLFPGITPRARAFGAANVSGISVSLSFVVFDPGDLPGYSASWGYASASVLDDPTGALAPGAISDNCTPLSTETTFLGMAGDVPYRINPCAPGKYTFRNYAASSPDADNDGFENAFDTCPYNVNKGDARMPNTAGGGDGAIECGALGSEQGTTTDAIDCACDPDPTFPNFSDPPDSLNECWPGSPGSIVSDCDGDGYDNRQDNCPLVANGTLAGPNDQADQDNDGIGDECDNNLSTVDGGSGFPLEDLKEIDVEITGDDICPAAEGEETPTPTPTSTPTATATPAGTATPTVTATTLAAGGAAGDTEIEVVDATGFAVGDTITIGTGDTAETCAITAISDSTLTLDCTLEFDHAAGESVVKAVVATPTATTVVGEGCAPVIPGTYNGLVRLNGVPAASGYEVTATIGGNEWGTAIVSGGRYALDIPQKLPSAEPCFEAGTITFTINGATCTPTEEWASGLHDVNLDCAAAVTPTVPPTTAPPTTPPPGTATPTATVAPAKPPVTGSGGLGGDQGMGMPIWAMVLAGWAGLTALAGVGTLATRIVKR